MRTILAKMEGKQGDTGYQCGDFDSSRRSSFKTALGGCC